MYCTGDCSKNCAAIFCDDGLNTAKTSSRKSSWRKQPRSGVQPPANSARRFNVTVVSSGPSGEGAGPPTSPVPRCRGQPFASIPEDQPLDESPIQQYLDYCSRSASPAPSWDFSNDSDTGATAMRCVPTRFCYFNMHPEKL
ncbi:uncharacterized protein LOC116172535 [Photinus pyralis]|uniref:uncharacterized protein LOC116172535 n=1 Tax=Photinus pyralis TaxID=7054 RepID=UPI0012676F03|nr:uncharacterized protein LOC116172535 [Photinus pyralis]